jgi:polyribonucleotide nucleotidyltransferase
MSPFAPRITILHINPDKIREVIGPGGKVIKKITEETGCQIDIEDTGEIRIAGVNLEGSKRAEEIIRNITEESGDRPHVSGQGAQHRELRRVRRDRAGS